MRRTDRWLAAALISLLAVPLLQVTASVASAALNLAAWQDLRADPQTLPALGLTLFTGLTASLLSVALAAWLLCHIFPGPTWARQVHALSPLLAVPHAAFAIGLAFWIAPSGWLLRLFSPWATGLQAPPPWPTTQDPWGLGLVAVLVFKEVPFLLWAAATQLQRADVSHTLQRELLVARSLGYAPRTAWWRVLWPQLWPRLRWPLLAVLAYSLSVVDVALIIGPTSPPTLAVLAWRWLLDGDAARNAQGASAAWLLAAVLGVLVTLAWQISHHQRWRARWTSGRRGAATRTIFEPQRHESPRSGRAGLGLLIGVYVAVMLALAVGSVAGLWPFPQFLPQAYTSQAWAAVGRSAATLGTTTSLGLCSALTALLWSVAWLECAPPLWRSHMRWLIFGPLVLPPVLWVVGLHGMSLYWGMDATWAGLWLAHTLAAVPYVLMALGPAYTGFNTRLEHAALTLGRTRSAFLWHVKWPLLRTALASAFAIGFAVSVAQYLPTLFVGAGRFNTVTTEAVTLAAGAQRALTAAYAWLQWLLPMAAFTLAAWLGKPRQFS